VAVGVGSVLGSGVDAEVVVEVVEDVVVDPASAVELALVVELAVVVEVDRGAVAVEVAVTRGAVVVAVAVGCGAVVVGAGGVVAGVVVAGVVVDGAGIALKTRVAAKNRDHQTSEIFTTSPVVGEWIILPLPIYMPTWWIEAALYGSELKNSRSPGSNA